MVDNPTKIYKDYVRTNLPNVMSYRTNTDRYSINNHSFFKFKNANWYYQYISKYGYSSAYAVLGFDPALAFDFINNYFRKGGNQSTITEALVHNSATAGNATMVDSDGNIKWRPHNLLQYSEDLTADKYIDFGNTGNITVIDSKTLTFAAGLTRFSNPSQATNPNFVGQQITGTVELSSQIHAGEVIKLELNWRGGDGIVVSHTLTTTPTFVSVTGTVPTGATGFDLIVRHDAVSTAKTFTATKWHAYRSDLGGMVNNPETGDSYVPTTSTARYLPRVGHHIYNGDDWVNEGLLHESEARTNLLSYSDDFTSGVWSKGNNITLGTPTTELGFKMTTLTDAEATSFSNTILGLTLAPSTVYTMSGYVARNPSATSEAGIRVNHTDSVLGAGHAGISINPIDGTFNSGSWDSNVTSRDVIPYGPDHYFCYVTFTTPANIISSGFQVFPAHDNIASVAGPSAVGSNSFGGLQLEKASTPSSYIPTSGSTVTRAAETFTVPAANMPWPEAVNPLAVSIQMDGRMTYADTDGYGLVQFHRWERDSSNRIYKSIDGFGTNIGKPVTVMTVLGVTDYSIGDADHYSPGINVPFNYADRYGSTFVNSALEGTALTANTTPVGLPDLSYSDLTLGKTFMGTIGGFRVWADDLGDAGLVEATSPSLEPSLSLTFDGSQTSFTVSDWSE